MPKIKAPKLFDKNYISAKRKILSTKQKYKKAQCKVDKVVLKKRGLYSLLFLFLTIPFSVGADTTIESNMTFDDSDGWVTQVEFYRNPVGTKYAPSGTDTMLQSIEVPLCLAHYPDYTISDYKVYAYIIDEASPVGERLYKSENYVTASDMYTTCNWYNDELFPFGHQWETFTFGNNSLTEGKDYYFTLEVDYNGGTLPLSQVAVHSSDDTETSGALAQYRLVRNTVNGEPELTISQVLTGQYAGTLVFVEPPPCLEHGTLGMFCPPIHNTANAFTGLFATAIVFTTVNLWPYLLGIVIVLIAYKYIRYLFIDVSFGKHGKDLYRVRYGKKPIGKKKNSMERIRKSDGNVRFKDFL
jgi:hypothetical protein